MKENAKGIPARGIAEKDGGSSFLFARGTWREAETVGWIPAGPGPRQFNKLGGVWIFLISRRSWTGGRA